MTTSPQNFDCIVIGGGAAGMMAAGRAAELGARVLLLEKNQRLGIKLLITGNGRCNVTNNISHQEFIKEIQPNGKFLHSSLNLFGPVEMMEFLERRGLKLQTEEFNRVFPKSNRSTDVLNVLKEYLHEGKVTIMYDAEVIKFIKQGNLIEGVLLASGQKIFGSKFILTTGGKSFPETGSTGMGYALARNCGHKIVDLRPALTSINVRESWVRELEGVSLEKSEVSIMDGEKKIIKKLGDLIFTGSGVGGPVIYDLSSQVSLFAKNNLRLMINIMPQFNKYSLDESLQEFFHRAGNKQLKNGLAQLMPAKLAARVIAEAAVDGDKKLTEIMKTERASLVKSITEFKLMISGVANFDRAYVTAGGVDLREINPKRMQSIMVGNLYFAGEVLDVTGPTGGFNLQIAWSTGFAAGTCSAQ